MIPAPHDSHGRRFEYLRLSLTDVCNFRCSYCLPDGHHKQAGEQTDLSVDEIRRLVTAFARLGLWKVRLWLAAVAARGRGWSRHRIRRAGREWPDRHHCALFEGFLRQLQSPAGFGQK